MSNSEQTPENQQPTDADVENVSAEAVAEQAGEELSSEDLIAQLREQLETTQQKADENWDSFVRLQAEMDNNRKRSEKQVEDAHKYCFTKIRRGFIASC